MASKVGETHLIPWSRWFEFSDFGAREFVRNPMPIWFSTQTYMVLGILWGYKFWQLQGPKVGLQDSHCICIFEDAVVPPGPSVAVQHFSDTFCWYPVEVASEPTSLIDNCSGNFDVEHEHLSKHPLRPTESKKIGSYQLTISMLYPILLKVTFFFTKHPPRWIVTCVFFSWYLCTCM